MAELYLPGLSHFMNNNFWTASEERMRYRVAPEEENLVAEVWEGPWEYEFSIMEEKQYFPLSEEGLLQIAQWAESWSGRINTRPVRTLAESLAMRDKAVAQKKTDETDET